MKIMLSEVNAMAIPSTYSVRALLEEADSPADALELGFLPAIMTGGPAYFFLSRSIRVRLSSFEPTSEDRRILKRGPGLVLKASTVGEFHADAATRQLCAEWGAARWTDDDFDEGAFGRALASANTSHVLTLEENARIVALVTCLVVAKKAVHYGFAFYDVSRRDDALGIQLLTRTVSHFAAAGFEYAYLGTCQASRRKYKVRFKGTEFFDGRAWSTDLRRLHRLLDETGASQDAHVEGPNLSAAWLTVPSASVAPRSKHA